MRVTHLPVICTALVFFIASWNNSERIIVLIAAPLLVWLFVTYIRKPLQMPDAVPIVVAAVALLGYDLLAPRITGQGQPDHLVVDTYARFADLVWVLVAAALLYRLRKRGEINTMWRAGIVTIAAVLGAALIVVTPEPAIDVWHLHQQAGDAMFKGANPYADIGVPASFPADEDSDFMTGYPYTPPNLVVFGTSAALTGDSRWFSLACWIGFLALFAILRPGSPTGTALLFLLSSQPAWHIVLEIAYTESVTLLLLVGAVAAWKHRRVLGSILLGVALASKQYLVVLAPMVVAARILSIRERMYAMVAAAVAAAVGFVWGVGEYFDAVVAFHLRVPPQPPSVNLYGITHFLGTPIRTPAMLGVGLSILVGLVAARTARTPSQLLVGAAAALGGGFFLASQAFVNYWLLVGAILCLALLLADGPTTATEAKTDPSVTGAAHA